MRCRANDVATRSNKFFRDSVKHHNAPQFGRFDPTIRKLFLVPIRFLFLRSDFFEVGFGLFFVWSQCVNRDVTALCWLKFSRLIIADVCLGYLLLLRANFADKQYNIAGAN